MTEGFRIITESDLLVHRGDLLHVLLVKLEIPFQVRFDPFGRLGFGNHAVSLIDGPCCVFAIAILISAICSLSSLSESTLQAGWGREREEDEKLTDCHLGRALVVFLADVRQDRLVEKFAQLALVEVILIAKGTVLGDVDAVLLMEIHERLLLKPRMKFELVSSGNDIRFLEETFDFGLREVRDANRFGLACLQQLLHGSIGLQHRSISVVCQCHPSSASKFWLPYHKKNKPITIKRSPGENLTLTSR